MISLTSTYIIHENPTIFKYPLQTNTYIQRKIKENRAFVMLRPGVQVTLSVPIKSTSYLSALFFIIIFAEESCEIGMEARADSQAQYPIRTLPRQIAKD